MTNIYNLNHVKTVAEEFNIPVSLAHRICFSQYSFIEHNMRKRMYKPTFIQKLGTFRYIPFKRKMKNESK